MVVVKIQGKLFASINLILFCIIHSHDFRSSDRRDLLDNFDVSHVSSGANLSIHFLYMVLRTTPRLCKSYFCFLRDNFSFQGL